MWNIHGTHRSGFGTLSSLYRNVLGASVPGIRDVVQLFAIYRHAVALDRREQAHAELLPRPHDPVNCRWIAQQFYRFESATCYVRQVSLVAVVTVTV